MDKPLVTIAVSSRALFDFEEENEIYNTSGEAAYMEIQKQRLDTTAPQGIAFSMVKKLLAFNNYSTDDERLVDVIVASRNDPITGLRVLHALDEYKLDVRRSFFSRGNATVPYLSVFGADLFLSAFEQDVRAALAQGVPAAQVLGSGNPGGDIEQDTLRIAFDGDAVLFDDSSERVFQEQGLDKFQEQENKLAKNPLPPGPLKPFLEALIQLRQKLPSNKIRTALITARGKPSNKRPLGTFIEWGISVDEAFFLSGMQKQGVLDSFKPDFFFDDQKQHLNTKQAGGHVPHGVVNEKK